MAALPGPLSEAHGSEAHGSEAHGSGGFSAAERSGWASAPATPRWRGGTAVGMPNERIMNIIASGPSRGSRGMRRVPGRGRSLGQMAGVGAYKTPLPWERRLFSRRKERMGFSPRDSGGARGTPRGDARRTAPEPRCERALARQQGNAPCFGKGTSLVRMAGNGAYNTPLPREQRRITGKFQSVMERLEGPKE